MVIILLLASFSFRLIEPPCGDLYSACILIFPIDFLDDDGFAVVQDSKFEVVGLKGSRMANEFFRLLMKREFASAESLLARIEDKLRDGDWKRGYLNALEGILLSSRSRSSTSPLARQIMQDAEQASSMLRDLKRRSRVRWDSDFDRGYFTAWTDYLKIVVKSEKE